jgi:hypothetical protein
MASLRRAVDPRTTGAKYMLAALRLFGFNYQGLIQDDDPEPEDIVLAGFSVYPGQAGLPECPPGSPSSTWLILAAAPAGR